MRDERDQAKPAHLSHTPIPRGNSDVGYAPARPPYVCKSKAGRMRQAHVPDGDGVCIFCSHKVTPGMEAR